MTEPKKRVDIFHKPTGDEVIHDLIWTVPNLITLIRLLCIPVFVWLIFGPGERYIAAWLLGGLGATDWVDGYLARRLDQSSEIGRLLDPTVDRLMFIVGIAALIIDESVAIWFAVAVLATRTPRRRRRFVAVGVGHPQPRCHLVGQDGNLRSDVHVPAVSRWSFRGRGGVVVPGGGVDNWYSFNDFELVHGRDLRAASPGRDRWSEGQTLNIYYRVGGLQSLRYGLAS